MKAFCSGTPGPSRQTGEPGEEGRETNPFHISRCLSQVGSRDKTHESVQLFVEGDAFSTVNSVGCPLRPALSPIQNLPRRT